MRSLLILSSLLVAVPAIADEVWIAREPPAYERRHFYLGAEAVGSVLLNETGSRQVFGNGGGVNLFLGGRLSRHAALEFGWSPTFYGQFGNPLPGQVTRGLSLSALSLDLKLYPFLSWVQPYVAFGPSAYVLTDNSMDYLASGGGWQLGGGVDFWLTRHLSAGFKTQYRGIALVDFDGAGSRTYLSLLSFAASLTGRF
jgi:Outer membrane protein beta-barrel domain